MLERTWKTLGGSQSIDLRTVLQQELAHGVAEIHIGTDSQQRGIHTEYVTVVVALRPAKGARVFYSREKVTRIKSLRERLHKEVWMSTELGMELTASPDIGENPFEMIELTIHVDANPDERFKSSEYVQELAGLVVGQGFRVLLKPDSWAASHCADHAVKNKIKPVKGAA